MYTQAPGAIWQFFVSQGCFIDTFILRKNTKEDKQARKPEVAKVAKKPAKVAKKPATK